jgi:SAM-dependent methyltransferase
VTPAGEVYARLLTGHPCEARLRSHDGRLARLPVERWLGSATAADHAIAAAADGPVLDVGCGPGRLLHALRRRGTPALGVDLSPTAVGLARRRGGRAVVGCVFGDVPEPGTWATALLLDGNIGIGGDPAALLRRVRALLRPGGRIVAEVEPGTVGAGRARVRLEAPGTVSHWFWWARVGADDLPAHAQAAGLAVAETTVHGDRRFAWLEAG